MSYSKKAMNKSDREEIVVNMISDACKKGVKDLNAKYKKQYEFMEQIMVDLFKYKYPGVDTSQWPALMQDRIIKPADYSNHLLSKVKSGDSVEVENTAMGISYFTLSQRPGVDYDSLTSMLRRVLQSNENQVVLATAWRFNAGSNSVRMKSDFPNVPTTKRILVVDKGLVLQCPSEINHRLQYAHRKLMALNEEYIDLIRQAYDLYEEIHAGIAAVRTPHQLAELMPVSVKHFPDAWINEPKKELADPAYLNELNRKLKAGLPV